MLTSFILFAQEKAAEKAEPGGIGALLGSNPIVPIMIVMALFFFLIILPAQRRQRKDAEALMSGMKKNDEVVTAGGIIGIVAIIKDNEDEVTLKIDDNARIRVLKSSIVRIKKKDEPAKDAPPASPPTPVTPPAANTNIKPT